MSDRSLPGVHDAPRGRRGRFLAGVLVVLAVVAVAWGCSAMAGSRTPYDADNPREAVAQCEARIERLLKAPATAEFDSTASGGGTWTVSGVVDAANSFGAVVRADYQCTVKIDGDVATTTVDYFND